MLTRSRGALLAATNDFLALEGHLWAERTEPEPSHDWSLTQEALRFLAILVEHLEPRQVVEFGSGMSTRVLGRACAELATPAMLMTIENDPLYAARARADIAGESLDRTVQVVSAPIVVRRYHDRNVPVYLLDDDRGGTGATVALGSPDLVVVDGPPLPLGGREGALHQALYAAHGGTVIVLDDSRRESERDLLVRMLRLFDGHVEAMDLLGFPKGLAVMLVTEPIGDAEGANSS